VHFKDLLPPLHIRQRHHHLAVKAPRSQKRRVQHVGTVGRRNQNHAFVGLEAVHFHQQLVERLLPLVMSAAQTGAPMAPYRVDFIDKNDAGGVFLCLAEKVPHAGRSNADKHFHKIRAADAQKRHVRLPGNRARQKGFSGSGRPHQQKPLGNAAAQFGIFLGVFQKIDDLFQLRLCLIDAGHIGKGHFLGLVGDQARAAFAERHRFAASRLHLAHEENPHADQQKHGEPGHENHVPGIFFDRFGGDFDVFLTEHCNQAVVFGGVGLKNAAVGQLAGHGVSLNGDFRNFAVCQMRQHFRVGNFFRGGFLLIEQLPDQEENQKNRQDKRYIFLSLIQYLSP